MEYLLEVCVDSAESARYAQQGGADRLELCANLMIGGTSPTPALIREVLRTVDIPVNVLLRPRFGDFCFTPAEKRVLLDEIAECRRLGVNGVVIGALTEDGALDVPFLRQCAAEAGSLHKTLHRVFDLTRDPFEALEAAIDLGFDTILTSGQQASAPLGAKLLGQLQTAAAGRIHILAGAGVNADNIGLLAQQGIRHFHCSGKHAVESPVKFRREGVPMGLPMADEYMRSYTDEQAIRAIKDLLTSSTRPV